MKIALGTAQFGLNYGIANKSGIVPQKEVEKILQFCRQHGISTIDTAISYADSQDVLGKAGIDGFSIVTKLPRLQCDKENVEDQILSLVSKTLGQLRTNSLYAILLHHPSDLKRDFGDKICSTLKKLKKERTIQKIGLSVYDPEDWYDYAKFMEFDLIQCPYNLFDQRLTKSGLLNDLKLRGVEVHTRSVFLQGALLLRKEDRPKYFSRWNDIWSNYDQFIIETGRTPLQTCFEFAILNDMIDQVVVGVDSLEQLKQLLSIKDRSITEFPESIISTDNMLINPSNWNF